MLSDEELDRLAQLGVELKQLEAVGADECDLGEQRRVAAKQRFKARLLQYGERLIAQAREANRLRLEIERLRQFYKEARSVVDDFNTDRSVIESLRMLRLGYDNVCSDAKKLRIKAELCDEIGRDAMMRLCTDKTLDWMRRYEEADDAE